MIKATPQTYDVFSSAWLAGASKEGIGALAAITEFVEFPDKAVVYALGGPQEWLWGVASGRVQVRVALTEMEPVLGHIHQPGAWFGESELLQGIDGLVEMKAVGATTACKIPYGRFKALANQRPELWEAFARLTSMNQLLAMSAANDLVQRTSRKRLAATLMRLSGRRGVIQGSWTAETVHASQQDLANLANVSLSKASLHLGNMAREGLIRLEYGQTVLTDPVGLQDMIEA